LAVGTGHAHRRGAERLDAGGRVGLGVDAADQAQDVALGAVPRQRQELQDGFIGLAD
jgi:hypothetical protein